MTHGSRLRRGGTAAVLLLALACGSPTTTPTALSTVAITPAGLGETVGPTSNSAPSGSATAGQPSARPSDQPPGPSGQTGSQTGLLLTEIGFSPVVGDHAFAEISNTSSAPIDMAGTTLRLGENDLPLGGLAQPLAAGAQLLVVMDGLGMVDGNTLHAASGFSLAADTGVVQLLDSAGTRLDRVAWGDAQPHAVPPGPGGIVPATFPAGSTIGRAPAATSAGTPDEWIVNSAVDASPGKPNPMPAVSVLLPISGAVLEPSQADLFWYPVPGATSYRVQVSTEPTFAALVLDSTMTEPQVNIATLAQGDYSWRVQALTADGTASRFSEPSNLQIAAATATVRDTPRAAAAAAAATATVRDSSRAAPAPAHAAATEADTPGKHLTVPLLSQHKDTAMLLLERNVEHGTHAWDVDHGALDPHDPADKKNCALATIAMLSKFYGGNLSQDRLGYEILQHREGQPPGPEGDLVYGHGISGAETLAAFRFALGDVKFWEYPTYDAMWLDIVTELDAGRPIAAANSHHGFVITGYDVTGGHRRISVNDPWPGRSMVLDLDRATLPPSDFNFWLMPEHPIVRQQEPSVTTDTDGDGVVDFDETERFKTNPNDKDTDADRLPDKQDIVTGVFDAKYGYAAHPGDPTGRDYDFDGIPTELDPDSDRGGCLDGDEDKDLDGHRNGSETWNFDVRDDQCSGWLGSITSTWDYGTPETNSRHGSLTASVIFEPDPIFPGGHFFVTGGTVTWHETGTSGTQCTLTGGGTYSLVVPGDETKPPGSRAGQLRIWDGGDPGLLRYSGIGHYSSLAPEPLYSTMECPSIGTEPSQETTDARNWLAIASSLPPPALGYTGEDSLTFPTDARSFSGSYTHKVEGEARQTWTWTFTKRGK